MRRLKAPERREQLLRVATKLFAHNGFDATTTAAIASAAGITEPILYRHFKGKQELFVAIVHQTSRETLDHWRQLIEKIEDPANQIRKIAREFPAHIKHLADQYHVLHGALASNRDKKVLSVLREHYDEIEAFLVRIFTAGQKAGQFRKDIDPETPAWQMIHSGIGFAMIGLNLSQFDHFSLEETIESILRAMSAD